MRLYCACIVILSLAGFPCVAQTDLEWRHYGQDAGGARFSPLDQITRENVTRLKRAWTFRTGDIAAAGAHYAECTPLMVEDTVYVITPFSRLIAINAITGKEEWRFSPDPPLSETETGAGGLASRGVAYWENAGKKRVFVPVRDGRIYSIDVETHEPDPEFGEGGKIDLRAGLPDGGGYLFLSSPPAVHDGVLLQPYGMNDTSTQKIPYVPLRAYDAGTGKALWTFNTVPQPEEFGHDTWEGDSWKDRGGCNPWTAISVDVELGYFYVATGAPNNDKYGGDRIGDNLYANSIIALEAKTGKRVWHFQTVHHDLWDYDLPAQPNLVELTVDGAKIPAVAVAGKTGFVYLFDRRDGTPVFPIEEREVPESDYADEVASKTQPFPTKPPAFVRQTLSEEDLYEGDALSINQLKERLSVYRSEGIFTPPAERGTIVFPGQLGGANWSGATVTPDGMMYVTANELPYFSVVRESGSPFGATAVARHFRERKGYPGVKPPWGTLTKLDLNAGTLEWQIPLGDDGNIVYTGDTGLLNFGGATATAGGVVFVAATEDRVFRAVDADTGRVLFATLLDVAGYGAPISYQASDGKQYVLIFAGGGGKTGAKPGDYVIAFTLNDEE